MRGEWLRGFVYSYAQLPPALCNEAMKQCTYLLRLTACLSLQLKLASNSERGFAAEQKKMIGYVTSSKRERERDWEKKEGKKRMFTVCSCVYVLALQNKERKKEERWREINDWIEAEKSHQRPEQTFYCRFIRFEIWSKETESIVVFEVNFYKMMSCNYKTLFMFLL